MLHATQALANDNDLSDLFAPFDEPEGYADFSLQAEIAKAVHRIRRKHRQPIRVSNRSESEDMQDHFAALLRPYGLGVHRLPERRAS